MAGCPFWRTKATANNRVIVRAWDSAGNTQPEDVKTIWNFKGYMNNSWHQIEVTK
ncbi:MAG: hypothetical protein V7K48_20855 [Nostoc sp.]|uniref:hypothetical protein n=1 Tax=Nostoc sp. TaxID=1180 RepID=UPI002FFC0085